MTSKVLVTLVVIAAIFAIPCHGFCISPPGWQTKSLVERIEIGEADVVVIAEVDAIRHHYGTRGPHRPKGPYSADLRVQCVFKDASDDVELSNLLKDVEGFGGSWDCANTQVELGKTYIVLLNRDGDRLKLAEVNDQEGAEEAIPSRLAEVEQTYPCI